MHSLVYHNGRILPLTEVRLSPGQAGLFNGWGLFTTMRVYGGQPFAFERHWRRLSSDAERIDIPLDLTPESVREALCKVIAANDCLEGTARIYFTHNTVGSWAGDEPLPPTDTLIVTNALPTHAASMRLTVQAHGRHAAHPLAGAKVLSWLPNNWIIEQAHARGFDEALLLNERGEVSECTSANIFCVTAGVVETPPLASGCLPGVTREVLLELGRGDDARPAVRERVLTMDDVRAADEVFVSSTTREVLAVSRIEDHEVPVVGGPISRRLADAFAAYVTRYFAASEGGAPV